MALHIEKNFFFQKIHLCIKRHKKNAWMLEAYFLTKNYFLSFNVKLFNCCKTVFKEKHLHW